MPAIVSIGEALVEVMRTERDRPLDRPAALSGPYPSGAPAIFASAAARLGAGVGFVGTVGTDAFGECVANRLAADGIDCAALRRVPDRLTGIAFVAYNSDGARSFIFHLAHSAAALVEPDQIPDGYLSNTRYLHVMGSSLTLSDGMRESCYQAAETVKRQGGTVSLDPNLRPELMPVDKIRAVCEPILRCADIVLPSGEEAALLTGAETPAAAARALLEAGAQLVAIKKGAQGSTIYTRKETLDVTSVPVDEVDPTGAGDCFDAALLVRLAAGDPIEQAARFANAAGALATTRLGPMEGACDETAVRTLLREQRA